MIPFSYLAEESNEQEMHIQKRLAVLEDLVQRQGLLLSHQKSVLDDLTTSNRRKDRLIEDNEAEIKELIATVERLETRIKEMPRTSGGNY